MNFGTSGVRGLASELVGKASGLYVDAFAKYLLQIKAIQPNDVVFVGRDLRESSPRIMDNCMAALALNGLRPADCGVLPTPALAHYAGKNQAAGVMVTGSHIPADRNGIKFFRPDGEISKLDEAEIARKVAALSAGYDFPACSENPPLLCREEALVSFEERYKGLFERQSLSGMRIGVYQHSSAGRDLLVKVLRSCGAAVVPIGRTDHFVPVDTEAVGPEMRKRFVAWTREYGLDALVSTDGDADRPLVADENGALLRGDLIGLVTALFLAADTVVTPVTANSGISSALGFEVLRTKVGSPHVIEAMNAAVRPGRTVVGFEANGGVLLASDWSRNVATLSALPTRDSFLPILAVLRAAVSSSLPVSKLCDGWQLPICSSDRLEDFEIRHSLSLLHHLDSGLESLGRFFSPFGSVVAVDKTDGLRVTLDNGEVIHLRPSGNAPELRCYSEAATLERANTVIAQALDSARSFASGQASDVAEQNKTATKALV